MSRTLQVPADVIDNVVGFIELSSLTTKRACDEVKAHRTAQEKAAALRPTLLDQMIRTKVVPATQKEAADSMLCEHVTTMTLLQGAIEKIAELNGIIAGSTKQAGDVGTSVDGSEYGIALSGAAMPGEYNSLTHPFVGEKTAFVKESDKAFLRLIGK